MLNKKLQKSILNAIATALTEEIRTRSLENLSSLDFSALSLSGMPYGSQFDKTGKHQGTYTNKGVLARSGYVKHSRGQIRHEVGFNAPYAYSMNWGSGPHIVPFEKLYDWAWYRRKEPWFPKLPMPTQKNQGELMKSFVKRYQVTGSRKMGNIGGHKFNKAVFAFTFYVWNSIRQEGTEPTFYWSDAVYTTMQDKMKLVKNALSTVKGVTVK